MEERTALFLMQCLAAGASGMHTSPSWGILEAPSLMGLSGPVALETSKLEQLLIQTANGKPVVCRGATEETVIAAVQRSSPLWIL